MLALGSTWRSGRGPRFWHPQLHPSSTAELGSRRRRTAGRRTAHSRDVTAALRMRRAGIDVPLPRLSVLRQCRRGGPPSSALATHASNSAVAPASTSSKSTTSSAGAAGVHRPRHDTRLGMAMRPPHLLLRSTAVATLAAATTAATFATHVSSWSTTTSERGGDGGCGDTGGAGGGCGLLSAPNESMYAAPGLRRGGWHSRNSISVCTVLRGPSHEG